MMKTVFTLLAVCLAAGAADFTYTDKTEITGGSMKGMMSMAARFSKDVSTNTTTVHRIKADKMATQTGKSGSIVDLSSETMTAIDYDKKEYSVITFAEMAEAMKKMAAKMNPGASKQSDVKFNVTAENTGKTKAFQGVEARQHIIKVTAQAADPKSGSMDTTMELWVGKVPGSEVMREFGKRMAAKMAFNAGGLGAAAGMMGGVNMQGLGEAQKKMADMDGLPLYQIARIGGSGAPAGAESGQAQQAQPQQQGSNEGVAGALGRFGRLGRKNQNEQAPPAGGQQAQSGGMLLETTTEIVSWSPAAIDASLMAVPADFKQVEHPLKKQLK